MKKSLSIVIPAHDEERYLHRCLDAIARQSVAPDQVIVVDNNSTDRTVGIARSYPFVTVASESRQGIVYARNRGFSLSRTDIIGRIDADTVLPDEWVETILAHYDDPAHASTVVTGGTRFYNLHMGNSTARIYDLIVHRYNRLLLGYYFPWGSNAALPAQAWRDVEAAVCVRTDVHEDLDLGIHLREAGYTIVYKPRLRVGAVARRIMTERGKLWDYLRMWAFTMRRHGVRLWALSLPVSLGIYLGSYAIFALESVWNRLGESKDV